MPTTPIARRSSPGLSLRAEAGHRRERGGGGEGEGRERINRKRDVREKKREKKAERERKDRQREEKEETFGRWLLLHADLMLSFPSPRSPCNKEELLSDAK